MLPTGIVLTTVPVDASISMTERELGQFVTQTWVPSDDTAPAALPTGIVLTTVPVDASISLTVPSPAFATQTCVPSDDTPPGPLPTGIVLTIPAADAEDTPIASQRAASTASAPSDRTILITTALR